MSRVPYPLTAIRSDDDSSGKNIVPYASVSVVDANGNPAQIYLQETGGSPSSHFALNENGFRQIWAEPGRYTITIDGGETYDIFLTGDLSDRVQSVATIADLQALTSANNGQTFIVQSGANTGEFIYNSSGSGSASFNNIVPNTLSGRFEKLDSSSAQVVLDSVPQRLDEALGALDNRLDGLASVSANVDLDNTTPVSESNLHSSTEIILSPPTGFSWVPDFAIYRKRGGDFAVSVDPRNYMPPVSTVELYVSKISGDDSNAGTPDQPFKSLAGALASAAYTSNTTDGAIIYIDAGYYNATESLSSGAIVRPTALICKNGMARISGGFRADELTWFQVSAPNDSVWRTNMVSFGGAVWDSSLLTGDGFYTKYSAQASIADVQANPGSYYHDGTWLYVHDRLGAMSPRIANFVSRSSSAATQHSTSKQLYCENISFELGQGFALLGQGSDAPAVFNKCHFKYFAGNGLNNITRQGLVYLFDCLAAYNGRDGFNYEYAGPDRGHKVLEVNCTAMHNGWSRDVQSNNGSTGHAYSVIIRVGCFYDRNWDRAVHDINDSQSWNIGCHAGRGINGSAVPYERFSFGAGREGRLDDTRMWIDSCTASGDAVDLFSGKDSIVYVRRSSTMSKFGEGDFLDY